MSVSKTFSESEVEDIMRLSRSRHDAKHINIRNVGSLNKAKDDTDPKQYTAHFTGLIGEYVWAWHSNQEVDKRVFAHGDKEDFKDDENIGKIIEPMWWYINKVETQKHENND